MPWKGEKDPYKIWISEIILQQTRVEQGWTYYERFIKKFPNIKALASAPEEEIFKLWEGLGYYSRCRNLIASARILHNNYQDKFPETYQEILELKGIGPYTAAAIASFAFNLPHAVVDGNVFRVISRFFGIEKPINSNEGRKFFVALSEELLDSQNPAAYNQAIMDFGATVCKPVSPLCKECPFKLKCSAYRKNKVAELPIKTNSISKKTRWLNYYLIRCGDGLYIKKRTEKDIWQNLYEFFLVESKSEMCDEQLKNELSSIVSRKQSKMVNISGTYKQKLTHQDLFVRFIELTIDKPIAGLKDFELVKFDQLKRFPFPKLLISFLLEKNVNLSQD
ncbi:MAG: A/G-specific adenine glycosylase [Bacteroidetes bacterium]|nr:MAG: A/G-specific adenine glycosylase [Bacteroidota bacterium]